MQRRVDLTLKDLLNIPNIDLRIPASRGEVSTVGAKLDACDVLFVRPPFPEFQAGRGPTESDTAVFGGRGQVLAVRAEHDPVDAALMAHGGKRAVPQPDRKSVG